MGWLSNRTLSFPLFVYLAWRGLILFYQVFLEPHALTTQYSDTVYERIFLSWTAYWDTGHFGEIARLGYHGHPQLVLFPLWPLLIKVFTMVTIHRYWAIFVLSTLLSLSVFTMFYHLAHKLIGKQEAKKALLVFAAYPGTFFLHTGYSENLFLVVTLLAFYAVSKRRMFLSSLLGALASGTRLVGIGISAVLLITHGSILQRAVYAITAMSGFLIYMLYLATSFGNPLAFFTSQAGWEKAASFSTLVFPLAPLANMRWLSLGLTYPLLSPFAVDWFVSVIFFGMTILVQKRLGFAYTVYVLTVLALPLASGTYVGMNRYVLPAFPVFMVLATLIRSKLLLAILCGVLLALQFHFITLFTNLVWVG